MLKYGPIIEEFCIRLALAMLLHNFQRVGRLLVGTRDAVVLLKLCVALFIWRYLELRFRGEQAYCAAKIVRLGAL